MVKLKTKKQIQETIITRVLVVEARVVCCTPLHELSAVPCRVRGLTKFGCHCDHGLGGKNVVGSCTHTVNTHVSVFTTLGTLHRVLSLKHRSAHIPRN